MSANKQNNETPTRLCYFNIISPLNRQTEKKTTALGIRKPLVAHKNSCKN
jgi:hypothetical protein